MQNQTIDNNNIDSEDRYSHFSAYGSCLIFIRDKHRLIDKNCTYDPDLPLNLFYTLSFIGAVNNAMSIIVFAQAKYDNRLLPMLLRVFYGCNFSVVFFLNLNFVINYQWPEAIPEGYNFIHNLIALPYRIALKTSNGILAYMAVLRCVNAKWPMFIAFSRHARTLSYLVLMVIFTLSVWIHIGEVFIDNDLMDADHVIYNALYHAITMFIVVVFNVQLVRLMTPSGSKNKENCQSVGVGVGIVVGSQHINYSAAKKAETFNKIYVYAFISSLLFVVMTIPGTVYMVLPPLEPDWRASCSYCSRVIKVADYFLFLIFSSCFFDNMIYCLRCQHYRRNLVWGLNKLKHCQSVRGSDGYSQSQMYIAANSVR